MAFCGKCGAALRDEVAFCGACGNPVQAAPSTINQSRQYPQAQPKGQAKSKTPLSHVLMAISAIIVMVIGLLAISFIFKIFSGSKSAENMNDDSASQTIEQPQKQATQGSDIPTSQSIESPPPPPPPKKATLGISYDEAIGEISPNFIMQKTTSDTGETSWVGYWGDHAIVEFIGDENDISSAFVAHHCNDGVGLMVTATIFNNVIPEEKRNEDAHYFLNKDCTNLAYGNPFGVPIGGERVYGNKKVKVFQSATFPGLLCISITPK